MVHGSHGEQNGEESHGPGGSTQSHDRGGRLRDAPRSAARGPDVGSADDGGEGEVLPLENVVPGLNCRGRVGDADLPPLEVKRLRFSRVVREFNLKFRREI